MKKKVPVFKISLIFILITVGLLFSITYEFDTIGAFRVSEPTKVQPLLQQQKPVTQQPTMPRTGTQPARAMLYLYGPSLIVSKADTIQYQHQDALGSNRFSTSIGGRVISENVQYPYGAKFSEKGSANDYTFTGKERDSELYYYGARYYDPASARFLSIDPIQNSATSLYTYAANNPLRFGDPDGKGVVDFVKNNYVFMARTAALGVLSYYAIRNEKLHAYETALAGTAAGTVLLGAFDASMAYIGSAHSEKTMQTYATAPSPDRVSLEDIQHYTSFMREAGLADAATALENKAQQGLMFNSIVNDHFVVWDFFGNLAPKIVDIKGIMPVDFSAGGFVQYSSGIIDVGLFGTTDYMVHRIFRYYRGNPTETNLATLAHEGTHLTQSRTRMVLNAFLGFGYKSSLNLMEGPARSAANNIRNYYRSLPEWGRLQESPLMDAPLPNEDFGPPQA